MPTILFRAGVFQNLPKILNDWKAFNSPWIEEITAFDMINLKALRYNVDYLKTCSVNRRISHWIPDFKLKTTKALWTDFSINDNSQSGENTENGFSGVNFIVTEPIVSFLSNMHIEE